MTHRLAILAALLFISACSIFNDEETPDDYDVHGIDVSVWQGDIDWHSVRNDGIAFAYLKATEGGDHTDANFIANWEGARAAGLPRGAYHFYYFCRPVEEQISWFIQNVPQDPEALPPVLDMEWNSHSRTCRLRPPADQIRRDMRRFLDAVEAHYGKRPMIYTSVDFHRDVLVGAFNEYPMWVRSVAGAPYTRYQNRQWTMWQYTATGRVDGIDGNIDRNAYWGSAEDWHRFRTGRQAR